MVSTVSTLLMADMRTWTSSTRCTGAQLVSQLGSHPRRGALEATLARKRREASVKLVKSVKFVKSAELFQLLPQRREEGAGALAAHWGCCVAEQNGPLG